MKSDSPTQNHLKNTLNEKIRPNTLLGVAGKHIESIIAAKNYCWEVIESNVLDNSEEQNARRRNVAKAVQIFLSYRSRQKSRSKNQLELTWKTSI